MTGEYPQYPGMAGGPPNAAEIAGCREAAAEGYRAGVAAVKRAVLDIDAHAAALGEDEDGFVTGGYVISTGSLHRALGVIGHSAPKCGSCTGESHDCYENYRLRDALKVARDFIVHHPAVSSDTMGERWPVLIGIIDKALHIEGPSDG